MNTFTTVAACLSVSALVGCGGHICGEAQAIVDATLSKEFP